MIENKINDVDPNNTFEAFAAVTASQRAALAFFQKQLEFLTGNRTRIAEYSNTFSRPQILLLQDATGISAAPLVDGLINNLKTKAPELIAADRVMLLRGGLTQAMAKEENKEPFKKHSIIVMDGLFDEYSNVSYVWRRPEPAEAIVNIVRNTFRENTCLIMTTKHDLAPEMGGLLMHHDPARDFSRPLHQLMKEGFYKVVRIEDEGTQGGNKPRLPLTLGPLNRY